MDDSATHAQKEILKLSADVFHPKRVQIPPFLHTCVPSLSFPAQRKTQLAT